MSKEYKITLSDEAAANFEHLSYRLADGDKAKLLRQALALLNVCDRHKDDTCLSLALVYDDDCVYKRIKL